MDNETAKILVQQTLEDSFNKEKFTELVGNILNRFERDSFTYKGQYIFRSFADSINALERIGKYEAPDEKTLDILIAYLKRNTSLEQARSMQRNFIARYLNGSRGGKLKDAALVAFVSPCGDWRFSFVKMEYRIGDGGKIKEEITPARRFSFLVGKNEKSHTAQSRLLPLLQEDDIEPTIEKIEEAFSTEPVTQEFFTNYRGLFFKIKESLDEIVKEDPQIKSDFTAKSINTADFSKKLLGQIVFLYFLQKKGWFGVRRGKKWGDGSKHFLRELFEKKYGDYANFFNDILEPMFYEALSTERADDYYSRFNCRIPFLNGGLFDPINDYDWVNTDILLPDGLFSAQDIADGNTGEGILDIFDHYNFTVKEDEPLEKEVAIDPEMLGKVFENMLEVENRKSKGTYYTPREIVHYMCRESLTNHLTTELRGKADKEDIERLIKFGEMSVEHDAIYKEKKSSNESYSGKYSKSSLPNSIEKHADLIDTNLKEIRVCDPAVGSGAFAVGMMNEIVKARIALTPHVSRSEEKEKRSSYHFKRQTIKNCLYGVDIDSGAVEIAKLRLWLSLIVDEERREDIQPLPNLDYKIVQGNSLIELINYASTPYPERNKIVKQMKNLKDEIFNTSSLETKKQKRDEVNKLVKKLFEYDQINKIKSLNRKIFEIKSQGKLFSERRIERQDENKIDEIKREILTIKQMENYTSADHFEWHINFSEIFQEKEGFDLVIANPPYVRADSGEKHLTFRKELERTKTYETLYEKWDLMVPFIEKGLKITTAKGNLIYIVSNAICTSKYASKLLDYVQEKYFTNSINYFESMTVFDAGVVPVVLHFSKVKNSGTTRKIIRRDSFENIATETKMNTEGFKELGRNAFRKEFSPVTPQVQTINLGDICYMSVGMVVNADEKIAPGAFTKNDLISEEKTKINCRPYIEGKDIGAYLTKRTRYLEWGTKRVPKQLRRATFSELYEQPKIMRGRVTAGIYDDSNLLCNDSIIVFVRFIDLQRINNKSISSAIKKFNRLNRSELEKNSQRFNLKYILAILNSSFSFKYLNNIRRHRLENYFYPDDFRSLPIANISLKAQKPFISLVDKIITVTKSSDCLENATKQKKVQEYQKQIDQLVYKLYGLTEEEIRIVEDSE